MKTFWINAKEIAKDVLANTAFLAYVMVGMTLMLFVMSAVGGWGGIALSSLVGGVLVVAFEKAEQKFFNKKDEVLTVAAEQPLAAG